jgi:hypothetical protein
MNNLAKQLLDSAVEKGGVRERDEFFSVTDKKVVDAGDGDMATIEKPNGLHFVTILEQKIGKGKSFKGNEQNELQMVVQDRHNGKVSKKNWNVAVKNEDDGKLHYIVEALGKMEVGEEFCVEAFKMQNGKYGKSISKVASQRVEKAPLVEQDGDSFKPLPPLSDEPEIDPSSIPF